MKKNIQEEVSRIKTVMGMIKESEFKRPGKGDISPVEMIEKLKMFSQQIEEIAEEFAYQYNDTEYWPYINKIHSGLRSVSDLEGSYSRSDEMNRNIGHMIDVIKSHFEVDDSSVENDNYDEREERNDGIEDREPSDDEIFNGFGREGGINY